LDYFQSLFVFLPVFWKEIEENSRKNQKKRDLDKTFLRGKGIDFHRIILPADRSGTQMGRAGLEQCTAKVLKRQGAKNQIRSVQ